MALIADVSRLLLVTEDWMVSVPPVPLLAVEIREARPFGPVVLLPPIWVSGAVLVYVLPIAVATMLLAMLPCDVEVTPPVLLLVRVFAAVILLNAAFTDTVLFVLFVAVLFRPPIRAT